jgi:hypothetical protein
MRATCSIWPTSWGVDRAARGAALPLLGGKP